MFWSAGELARLAGTGVAERARDDAVLAAEDFNAHVPPLCAAHPERLPARRMTLDAFRAAASWVASRAFGVDSYHGARSSLGVRHPAERYATFEHMHPCVGADHAVLERRHVHGAAGGHLQPQGCGHRAGRRVQHRAGAIRTHTCVLALCMQNQAHRQARHHACMRLDQAHTLSLDVRWLTCR